ncbi:hypothetical protein Dimus_017893 [Dionaea muscipula]
MLSLQNSGVGREGKGRELLTNNNRDGCCIYMVKQGGLPYPARPGPAQGHVNACFHATVEASAVLERLNSTYITFVNQKRLIKNNEGTVRFQVRDHPGSDRNHCLDPFKGY